MQSIRRKSQQGFTLVELMIIVVIIGILAGIAIPTYMSYMYRSKTTEAIGFLAAIKARQEDYRALHHEYCNVSTSATDWWPAAAGLGSSPQRWASAERPLGWAQLGVSPPSPYVLFSYVSVAGEVGETPNIDGDSRGYTGNDYWFISRAIGDLDGDENLVTFESYSHRQQLWISEDKGWE